ncbi:hypothetical protein [Agrococcus sp. Marseille-Q4369]|uniref:hypothetical protein n=1 Tax=Agrococcus sp. Marseille-Q4369 TaxID=2810513 RepID=UPI001B8A9AA1|nr:hypothetical protein [Agrococcus sp. Marseille-Q4369]QUW17799.1 hypothetical protein JSQ78_07920 [Agrococcus sp. Marseille-Q4369]
MRADATHRFTFDVEGGGSFECIARTRSEAEQVARHAGAPVRLREQARLGSAEGDVAGRRAITGSRLGNPVWKRDLHELVQVLDHVRLRGGAASVVPVAALLPDEIVARGLQLCSEHDHAPWPDGRVPVDAPAAVTIVMEQDGGWELRLMHSSPLPQRFAQLEWERCEHGNPAVSMVPGCSVWTVAAEVMIALLLSVGMRPGELSAMPMTSDALAS